MKKTIENEKTCNFFHSQSVLSWINVAKIASLAPDKMVQKDSLIRRKFARNDKKGVQNVGFWNIFTTFD